jgi:excisionase family DNA binding protein
VSATAPKINAAIPRLALRAEEAAEALGVKPDFFREHVAPELRAVRRGRLKLFSVAELERWLERNGSRVLDSEEVG